MKALAQRKKRKAQEKRTRRGTKTSTSTPPPSGYKKEDIEAQGESKETRLEWSLVDSPKGLEKTTGKSSQPLLP